jgi:hypothetical protein
MDFARGRQPAKSIWSASRVGRLLKISAKQRHGTIPELNGWMGLHIHGELIRGQRSGKVIALNVKTAQILQAF